MTAKILGESSPGSFTAILFDNDGVLVDTQASCLAAWGRWASLAGIDAGEIAIRAQGRRVREVIAEVVDAALVDDCVRQFEAMELSEAQFVKALPGARDLLRRIPVEGWAVVTSASAKLATARLKAAGLPTPNVLVSSDDVDLGKPDPSCYLLASENLGVPIGSCLAIEDTAVGVEAARRAGAAVMVVGDDCARRDESSWHIADLTQVNVSCDARGGMSICVKVQA